MIGIDISINSPVPLDGLDFTPPLDEVGSAQTAFSIARLLREDYSGNAIRIRRSSDDAETDIGFTSAGHVDESAITDFVGSNSAYIVTAYDQSGNSNDWAQAASNLQTRIVNAGTLEKVNGKLAMWSDTTASSQDNLSLTISPGTTCTSFHVIKTDRDQVVINTSSIGGSTFYGVTQNGSASTNYSTSGTPTTYVNGSSIASTRDALHDGTINIQALVGFTALDLSSANWAAYNTDFISLDTYSAPTYIQEYIIYDSDVSASRTTLETNINDYYSIY